MESLNENTITPEKFEIIKNELTHLFNKGKSATIINKELLKRQSQPSSEKLIDNILTNIDSNNKLFYKLIEAICWTKDIEKLKEKVQVTVIQYINEFNNGAQKPYHLFNITNRKNGSINIDDSVETILQMLIKVYGTNKKPKKGSSTINNGDNINGMLRLDQIGKSLVSIKEGVAGTAVGIVEESKKQNNPKIDTRLIIDQFGNYYQIDTNHHKNTGLNSTYSLFIDEDLLKVYVRYSNNGGLDIFFEDISNSLNQAIKGDKKIKGNQKINFILTTHRSLSTRLSLYSSMVGGQFFVEVEMIDGTNSSSSEFQESIVGRIKKINEKIGVYRMSFSDFNLVSDKLYSEYGVSIFNGKLILNKLDMFAWRTIVSCDKTGKETNFGGGSTKRIYNNGARRDFSPIRDLNKITEFCQFLSIGLEKFEPIEPEIIKTWKGFKRTKIPIGPQNGRELVEGFKLFINIGMKFSKPIFGFCSITIDLSTDDNCEDVVKKVIENLKDLPQRDWSEMKVLKEIESKNWDEGLKLVEKVLKEYNNGEYGIKPSELLLKLKQDKTEVNEENIRKLIKKIMEAQFIN